MLEHWILETRYVEKIFHEFHKNKIIKNREKDHHIPFSKKGNVTTKILKNTKIKKNLLNGMAQKIYNKMQKDFIFKRIYILYFLHLIGSLEKPYWLLFSIKSLLF